MGGIGRDLSSELEAEGPFRVHDVTPVPEGAGQLRLDGNTLDWIALGALASQTLAGVNGDVEKAELRSVLFAEMLVTNNTFREAPHVFLATAVTLHGNVFEAAGAGFDAPGLGFVAAAVASATGNLGPDRKRMGSDIFAELVVHGDARANAGNARMTII